jgi:hypothetical protein
MPFVDIDSIPPDPSFAFDITIVGAGAAGILLAVKLSEAGKNVLLIESGHFDYDSKKQKLNEVTQSGKYLSNAVEGRVRSIGGTTIAWGGQSLPFSALDFSKREWVGGSHWPIDFKEVAKYYEEANGFMNIDKLDYKKDIFKKIKLKDPGFDTAKIHFHVSKWAPIPDFKKLYHTFLSKYVTVYYNAHLIKIKKNGSQTVTAISLSNFKGEVFQVPVRELVIAAGGIESIRILLNNNLGNQSSLLGKGFMDHPCIRIGKVRSKKMYELQRRFNTHIWEGRKYSLRLSLSEAFQEKEKTLNCSACLQFRLPDDLFDPYAEIKYLLQDYNPIRVLKLFRHIPTIIRSWLALINHKFYYKARASADLLLMVEQESFNESFINLSKEFDEFGQQRANIHWDVTKKSWHTVVKAAEILKSELERLGIGDIEIFPEIEVDIVDWKGKLTDVNHHMGGARMGNSSENGVVDANLRLWDTSNVYVCSSAVFPTSSHSNPTLTLLAIGCRLCDHLQGKN